jgi:hypothetical protein
MHDLLASGKLLDALSVKVNVLTLALKCLEAVAILATLLSVWSLCVVGRQATE